MGLVIRDLHACPKLSILFLSLNYYVAFRTKLNKTGLTETKLADDQISLCSLVFSTTKTLLKYRQYVFQDTHHTDTNDMSKENAETYQGRSLHSDLDSY